MSRAEDLLHLPTGEIETPADFEECINRHEEAVESAVVPFNSGVGCQKPLAFVILKNVEADRNNLAFEFDEADERSP